MTYEEMFITLINKYNRPLKFKELLDGVIVNFNAGIDMDCTRQMLTVCCKKGVIVKVKIKGTPSFYCKPEWTFKSKIQGKYNFNPYWNNKLNNESKQVQIQQPSGGLGRTA